MIHASGRRVARRGIAVAAIVPIIFTVILDMTPAMAGNWSQWRGPDGNSAAANAHPPTVWSRTKNVKWKKAVPGQGSGSPIVWEDRVFVVSAVPTDTEALDFKLFCFDREQGDLVWEQTAITAIPHERTHPTNGFASASPCTDGQHVYAFFGSRGLYCYKLDGTLVWKRDDFGQMRMRNGFGEGASTALGEKAIFVPWDHEGDSFIAALDKRTGKTLWRVARDEPSCWATPMVVNHNGTSQVVMNGQNLVRSYDASTGDVLWSCGGQTRRPVASPVSVGELVFVGSGSRGAFIGAFRLDGRGELEDSDSVVWTKQVGTPDIASPVLSGGRLFYTKAKSGIVTCVDAATGEVHFQSKRLPKLTTLYASPVAAGGHVYFTGRSGTTVVIKDQGTLDVVATNSVDETVDATPAPVDNQLFIRGEKHLFCIAE